MFTNEKSFGGAFGKEILKNIDNFNSLEVASGYFDPQTIEKNRDKLIQIAKRGYLKILIGMIYHEGVSKTQKKTLEELNKDNLISLGEIDSFVSSKVKEQSALEGREQTPELQGDADRVLVKFQ